MNDIDYINFISNQEVQQKIQDNKIDETDATLIDKFPQIKLPNKFFKNNGQLNFKDLGEQIAGDKATYSNGAVYADFDNDGDADIVVNNIDEPALLYLNKNNEVSRVKSLEIHLKGPPKNVNAIGARVVMFANNGVRVYEKFPVHGFLSSMEIPIHIGLEKTTIDSMFLVWPDNTFQSIQLAKDTASVILSYRKNLPLFDYQRITSSSKNVTSPVTDITASVGLDFQHIENSFQEFDREPLIPHMLSTEGPAIAIADANADGLDDVFIGSSKGHKSAVFLQSASGTFTKCPTPVIDNDSTFEDTDAAWADVNNDGNIDLIVASGGNEYYGREKYLTPRVYLNNGKAQFVTLNNAFSQLYLTASSIAPYDFNGDGYTDLFIGGRTVPWNYGQIPRSYLLLNDKTGKFKDVTALYAKDLQNVGFVTQGSWIDLDNDGDKDLILSLEWNGITAFINTKGTFVKTSLANKKGWWNFVTPVDIDNDGDLDLIAGNLGLNSRLKASAEQNVKMYFNDFDGNGKKEQVVTYYLNNKEIVFANKAELEKQMPFLKKKFLYAKDFASATLSEVFTAEKLDNSLIATADYFSNAILLNKGNWQFELQALPWEAQLTTYRDAVVVNANGDNLPDVMLVGNYYENNIEMGRYDADYGTLLINKGNGTLACESLNGLKITGQSRHVKRIKIANDEAFVIARNNEKTVVIKFAKPVTKK
jgi:hypothetical protein